MPAARAPRSWNTPANLLEARMPAYMAMCTKEAGKTLADGIAEVREAVDFCRYYAAGTRAVRSRSKLPGPTGESNQLQLNGRGVIRLHQRRGISRWRSSWAR
jgi:RHH-type proline utilization regulon transcriptional repressor/proline dehydrogenase/delta 1-pyrroline-5-carboxylate dehydrogenase